MRNDVVRIVWTRPLVSERPEDLAAQLAGCGGFIRAISVPGRALEHRGEIAVGERGPLAVRATHGRLGINLDSTRIDLGQEGLDLVVAERPEQLVRDDHRAGRALRVRGRVERDEPGLAAGVESSEPRGEPRRLLANDHPFLRCWRRPDVGSADDIVDGHRAASNSIREPARVGHLVDSIDVARAFVRRRALLGHEYVVGQVVREADVRGLRAGGVLGVRLRRDRVIAEEPGRLGRHRGAREHDGRCDDDQDAGLHECCWHDAHHP